MKPCESVSGADDHDSSRVSNAPNRRFADNKGQVALDQIRADDRERLIRRLGAISETTTHEISGVLLEMFVR